MRRRQPRKSPKAEPVAPQNKKANENGVALGMVSTPVGNFFTPHIVVRTLIGKVDFHDGVDCRDFAVTSKLDRVFDCRDTAATRRPHRGVDCGDIAHKLVDSILSNTSINWTIPEVGRAQMRMLAKDILQKHGYPFAHENAIVEAVLGELLAARTARRQ